MATVTKPSSFRRSTERKVTDPNEEMVAREERLREKEREAFEALSYGIGGGMCAAGVVRKPSFEELYDAMLAEDQSTFDADGVVR